jgi:predicted acylesterase/phospholipase RssA
MNPRRLVFTGGGTRCLVFVEALLVLETAGVLERVDEYWGTSAGAFIATLMALSDTVSAVRDFMYATEYVKFRDIDVNNLLNINKSWGLDNGHSLIEEVERILELAKPGSSSYLMSDIPGLTIIIANLSTHEVILCSAKTHPSLRVVDAIRASMSLPIFFRPYIHQETGHVWIDGAVGANFPWGLLPTDADRYESLGFTFEHGDVKTPTTVSEYIFSMIHFEGPKKIEYLKTRYPNNILWFPNLPFPAWFMRLQPADLEMIASIGSTVAKSWLTSTYAQRSCLRYLQGTNGSSPSYGDRCNPSPSSLPHRTEQTSDNPKSSDPGPPQDSSLPQSHYMRFADRRWSW